MSERPEVTWAPGTAATACAQAARYAAHHPLSPASAAAAGGETGPTSAAANASPSRGGTAGAASAFAGTVNKGTAWNCSQRIGAVATPHAADTATTPASLAGTGNPSSRPRSGGTSTKIAATAAKESWKPGSSSVYGFHARRTRAPRRKKCQRSTGRAASQARETSAPDTPARMTEGCAPTARTQAAMA